MKNKPELDTTLVDEYLKSIEDSRDAETDPFFYTRLKARMERREEKWGFSLKPALIIAMLTVMLGVNSFIIIKQRQTQENVTIQDFGNNYNITLSNY